MQSAPSSTNSGTDYKSAPTTIERQNIAPKVVASPSISIRQTVASEPKAEYKNSQTTFENQSFTSEKLQEAWRKYTQIIPSKVHLANTMLAAELQMTTDTEFQVTVENSYQEKELNDEKPNILLFLTKELQNNNVDFVVKITEFIRTKVLTDSEQLDEMSKRNPAFARLRNELKLDVY